MGVGFTMFSTSKCTYCRPVKRHLEDLQEKYIQLDVGFLEVDTDPEAMQMAEHWGVSAVPTVLLIADGELLKIFTGAQECSAENLENHVKGALQRDVLQEPSAGSDEGSCAVLRDPSGSEDV